MPARGSVTLFHVRGIRIGVDYSWFFVLFLIILWLSSFYRSVLDVPSGDAAPYLLALALACVAVGVAAAGSHEFLKAMRVEDQASTSGVLAVIAWVASINLLVLAFNLIPAFPLDGGRIARAIAWRVTGDRSRATRGAARLGQAFSYLFIGVGLLLLVEGLVVSGIWLALIG